MDSQREIQFYFSFKTSHNNAFWFLGDTQGVRFYVHGTTLHLFVILFPGAIHFALETILQPNRQIIDLKYKALS